MRNRFCASFRMAEYAKRTPELTRKVKNCNVPRNKIKSAIFWQKSYRLEWDLIICHYLNLYVHCISFITRLFLLWKLTGAKSNFETMCLQEWNLECSDSELCKWISALSNCTHIESSLIELESSVIELESSVIELESSAIESESSAIQLQSSQIHLRIS